MPDMPTRYYGVSFHKESLVAVAVSRDLVTVFDP
jgi:hypothetical protein